MLYYGYAHYSDGSCICHCYGTLEDVEKSEERIKVQCKENVTEFERSFRPLSGMRCLNLIAYGTPKSK